MQKLFEHTNLRRRVLVAHCKKQYSSPRDRNYVAVSFLLASKNAKPLHSTRNSKATKRGKKQAGDALVCSCIYLLACEQIKREPTCTTSVYICIQTMHKIGWEIYFPGRSARFFTAALRPRNYFYLARGVHFAVVFLLSLSVLVGVEEKIRPTAKASGAGLVSFAKLAPFRSGERLDRCQKRAQVRLPRA